MAEEEATVEEVIEPYLIQLGLLERSLSWEWLQKSIRAFLILNCKDGQWGQENFYKMMRILGIDPGFERLGIAILEKQ